MPLLIILALLLGAGGGLTVAANNAMPTELLYPLKVYVTETVVGLLQFSDEAKTTFQIGRAARRLEEAEQMASEGTFTPDARTVVESNFVTDIAGVEQIVTTLQSEKNLAVAAEVSSHFVSTLDAHARILLQLALDKQDEEQDLRGLASTVVDHTRTIARERGDIVTALMSSGDQELKITADQALISAQTIHDQTSKFIDDNADVLGADTVTKAHAQLDTIVAQLTQGTTLYDRNNFGAAYIYYQQVYTQADEIERLMRVRKSLHVAIDPSAGFGPVMSQSTPPEVEAQPAPTDTGASTPTSSDTSTPPETSPAPTPEVLPLPPPPPTPPSEELPPPSIDEPDLSTVSPTP